MQAEGTDCAANLDVRFVADLKRAETIRPKVGKGSTLGGASKSEVLRVAITRGLCALEQEYK